jgi:hypothetical protein
MTNAQPATAIVNPVTANLRTGRTIKAIIGLRTKRRVKMKASQGCANFLKVGGLGNA